MFFEPQPKGWSISPEYDHLDGQYRRNIQLDENLVPLVREISWSKNVVILKKCKDSLERQFY